MLSWLLLDSLVDKVALGIGESLGKRGYLLWGLGSRCGGGEEKERGE